MSAPRKSREMPPAPSRRWTGLVDALRTVDQQEARGADTEELQRHFASKNRPVGAFDPDNAELIRKLRQTGADTKAEFSNLERDYSRLSSRLRRAMFAISFRRTVRELWAYLLVLGFVVALGIAVILAPDFVFGVIEAIVDWLAALVPERAPVPDGNAAPASPEGGT